MWQVMTRAARVVSVDNGAGAVFSRAFRPAAEPPRGPRVNGQTGGRPAVKPGSATPTCPAGPRLLRPWSRTAARQSNTSNR